ncbi:hypothetical protein EK904_005363 [Melospiza melodia maxima]|nr:hypothetical protein EK904_005363 [Melospiza melodia maxima]
MEKEVVSPLRFAKTPSPPEEVSPLPSPTAGPNHMLAPASPAPARPKSPTQLRKGPPVPPLPKLTPTKELQQENIINLFDDNFVPEINVTTPSQNEVPEAKKEESLLDLDFDPFKPEAVSAGADIAMGSMDDKQRIGAAVGEQEDAAPGPASVSENQRTSLEDQLDAKSVVWKDVVTNQPLENVTSFEAPILGTDSLLDEPLPCDVQKAEEEHEEDEWAGVKPSEKVETGANYKEVEHTEELEEQGYETKGSSEAEFHNGLAKSDLEILVSTEVEGLHEFEDNYGDTGRASGANLENSTEEEFKQASTIAFNGFAQDISAFTVQSNENVEEPLENVEAGDKETTGAAEKESERDPKCQQTAFPEIAPDRGNCMGKTKGQDGIPSLPGRQELMEQFQW